MLLLLLRGVAAAAAAEEAEAALAEAEEAAEAALLAGTGSSANESSSSSDGSTRASVALATLPLSIGCCGVAAWLASAAGAAVGAAVAAFVAAGTVLRKDAAFGGVTFFVFEEPRLDRELVVPIERGCTWSWCGADARGSFMLLVAIIPEAAPMRKGGPTSPTRECMKQPLQREDSS